MICHAEEARKRGQLVLATLYNNAIRLALVPSLKPGKTEVLIAVHGQGSRAVRRTLDAEVATIHFPTTDGEKAAQVVCELKYLGALFDDQANLLPEIKTCGNFAHAAVRPLARQELKNPRSSQQMPPVGHGPH